MATESDVRCVIKVGNHLRRLFSITERDNGDLVINIRSGDAYREIGQLPPDDRESQTKILNQKYSVHRSIESQTGINAIKHTLNLADGNDIVTKHYTKALKQFNNFCLIYASRTPDLRNDKYICEADGREIINLGECNPLQFTLYYAILVGNKDRRFFSTKVKDISFKQAKFKFFRIVILWSFGMFVPDGNSAFHHMITIPPEYIPEHLVDTFLPSISGGDEALCLDVFRESCCRLRAEQFAIALKKAPEFSGALEMCEAMGFFAKANRDGEYIRRLKSLPSDIVRRLMQI